MSAITTKNTNKGEYREFRELLRRGIGDRSQRSFAKEAGISPEHLNRLLNQDEIGRPEVETLEKIAYAMGSISLNQLLEACGYETADPMEDVKEQYKQLQEALPSLTRDQALWENLDEAIGSLQLKCSGGFDILRSGNFVPQKEDDIYAERYTVVAYNWALKGYECGILFAVLYINTEKGRVLIRKVLTDRAQIVSLDHAVTLLSPGAKCFPDGTGYFRIKERMPVSEEDRAIDLLLKSIYAKEKFVRTEVGYGFYYRATPEGFLDFLTVHAGAFTTNKKNAAIYQAALEPDADMDEVFSEFEDEYSNSAGTGAVVAYILRKETGYPFDFFEKEEEIEDGEDDSCIMVEDDDGCEQPMPRKLMNVIYNAAKLLRIPRFGVCYHQSLEKKTFMQDYETDSFHLEY